MRSVDMGFDAEFYPLNQDGTPMAAGIIASPSPTRLKTAPKFRGNRVLLKYHDDSGLLEINTGRPMLKMTQPDTTLHDMYEVLEYVYTAADYLTDKLAHRLVGNTPMVEFDKKYKPQLSALGCRPDSNIFFENNPYTKPDVKTAGTVRTLGGHVHFSFSDEVPTKMLQILSLLFSAIDIDAGWSNSKYVARRALYGQVGACRVRTYAKGNPNGFEIRTMSTPTLYYLIEDEPELFDVAARVLGAYIEGFNGWDHILTDDRLENIQQIIMAHAFEVLKVESMSTIIAQDIVMDELTHLDWDILAAAHELAAWAVEII